MGIMMLRVYRIQCEDCPFGEEHASGDLTLRSAMEYYKKKGWKFVKNKCYCDRCSSMA